MNGVVENLENVSEDLENKFNPPTDEGVVGVVYGIGKGRRAGSLVVEFMNLSSSAPLSNEENAKCRAFINGISEERGFRSKIIPMKQPTKILSFYLRPV